MKNIKDELNLIKKTITIFKRYTKLYKRISKETFSTYDTYFAAGYVDEDEFVKPKLWVDFLQEVLSFPKDEYFPEHPESTGLEPDFTPCDTRAHRFIFEIKGSDCFDLSTHYNQVQGYIKPPIKWGVITNMRKLFVYEKSNLTPLKEFSFSFLELYQVCETHKSDLAQVLKYDNTKHFTEFVKNFSYRTLTLNDKIAIIKEASPWSGNEILDANQLIESVHRIVKLLFDDVRQYRTHLADGKYFHKNRQLEFAQEIDAIAREINRRRKFKKITFESLKDIIRAKSDTDDYRAIDIFMMRVAYFAMTRILVARMWEDLEIIQQVLYDGGFQLWYERLGEKIKDVLAQSFLFAAKQYSWLYAYRNNYDWFTPTEETIVEVLYEFAKYNLGNLNTDVLGTVYEEYVDRADRKNKGQYYTPREIISLIWDLVGYKNEDAFFDFDEGKRKAKLVFDPAVGSAGFLVEAGRRIQEISKYNDQEIDDLDEIFFAISEGLFGCDISVFSYYIAEVNLIIQISPILKQMKKIASKREKLPFCLSLISHDSLALHNPPPPGVLDFAAADTKVKEYYESFNILSDKYKKEVFDNIKKTKDFDYVCSNPPYIGEKGHIDLFKETLEKYKYWKSFHQGKMDYLYFFIFLGLSKLKEGGKLGFITTRDWLIADSATKLRAYILDNAVIHTVIDFGKTKIFRGAPGQHNIVFIFEKCSSNQKNNTVASKTATARKKKHTVKLVQVKGIPPISRYSNNVLRRWKNSSTTEHRLKLKSISNHIIHYIKRSKYSDEYINVFESVTKQGDLSEKPWNGLFMKVNVDKIICKKSESINTLPTALKPKQGIVPGVDRITNEHIDSLSVQEKSKGNIEVGNGVFVLTADEIKELNLTSHEKRLIILSYHNSHITEYLVDIPDEDLDYILYIDSKMDFEKYPNVEKHLNRYKKILKDRLERYDEKGYKETYEWYRLNRPRDRSALSSDKIVVSNWGTSWQPFAFQSKKYFEKRDITFFVKRPLVQESLLYFLAILNSSLMKWWMIEKARQLGYMRQSIQEQIPFYRINFNKPSETKIHNAIVGSVAKIMVLKKKLLPLNQFYKDTRLCRLNNAGELPLPDPNTITAALSSKHKRLLRNHSQICIEPKTIRNFYLKKLGKVEEHNPLFSRKQAKSIYSMILRSKSKETVKIIAPKEIINYIKMEIKTYIGLSWSEIKKLPVPSNMKYYKLKKNVITRKAISLLNRIEKERNLIDKAVYKLYGISSEEKKMIAKAIQDVS
jgi:type I restriction-modification system DNA methylase subunit